MKIELKRIIETNIDMALSNDYKIVASFCLEEKNGYYQVQEDHPSCHPLETIIVGQNISGCLNEDIAVNLEVSLQWVDGFVDGYCNTTDADYMGLSNEDPVRKKYAEGWEDGREVAGWIL